MDANTVYRDFNTDGVPASGLHNPVLSEIRTLLTGYEDAISSASNSSVNNLAELQALTLNGTILSADIKDNNLRKGLFTPNAGNLSGTILGPAIASTAVDPALDTITSNNHGLHRGHAVVATSTIDGLSTNTIYYAIKVDNNTFKLASSMANAVAGTAVDLIAASAVTVKRHFDPLMGVYVTPTADITGASGAWVRAVGGKLTPQMFGGIPGGTDAFEAIQAALHLARSGFVLTNVWDFAYEVDLDGKSWRTTQSLDLTELQQPYFILGNGTIYSTASGKIALDCAATNTLTLHNLRIFGDKTLPPHVAILIGRAKINGNLSPGPDATFINVQTSGYFGKSAFINLAAEVVSMSGGCQFGNNHRSVGAAAGIIAGNHGVVTANVGGITSEYTTLMADADGHQSCILHRLGDTSWTRGHDFFLPIVSITKANPAVVTLAAGTVVANGIVNGNQVWIDDAVGMTQLNRNFYTIAGISGDTFQLSGIDSTAFGTFTSGNIRNRTGPALIIGGADAVRLDTSYLLTYGNYGLFFDCQNANPIGDVKVSFQHEAYPRTSVRFLLPNAGSVTIRGLEINSFGINQIAGVNFASFDGFGGTVVFEDFNLDMGQQTSGVPIFANMTSATFRNVKIRCQYENGITAGHVAGLIAVENLEVYAADSPTMKRYGTSVIENSKIPVTKTANFTVGVLENNIIVNQAATTTVTLPAASSFPGRVITIKTIQAQLVNSASSNVVPLAGGAAGTATLAATIGKWAVLVSDGANWVITQAN